MVVGCLLSRRLFCCLFANTQQNSGGWQFDKLPRVNTAIEMREAIVAPQSVNYMRRCPLFVRALDHSYILFLLLSTLLALPSCLNPFPSTSTARACAINKSLSQLIGVQLHSYNVPACP